MDKVYVIGHLNPDTDTVVAAMAMALFLNEREKTNRYVPAMTGRPNSETEYIFSRFNLTFPEVLENAQGKKLFLVDHNEPTQVVKGFQKENILGFVDHHKISFDCPSPIEVTARPFGSSNTIIYGLFKKDRIKIPLSLRKAMLSAILSDTVILKSPTTTTTDMQVVHELSAVLKIDYQDLGMELFRAKAKIAQKTPEEIIRNDFKDFDFNGKKVGIGQIEMPDLSEVMSKLPSIILKATELKGDSGYHSIILMLTDIIKEGSRLLVVSDDPERIEGIFGIKLRNNTSDLIPGMMSRKKQVASVLAEKF